MSKPQQQRPDTPPGGERSYVEHAQKLHQTDVRRELRQRVRETINLCSRALQFGRDEDYLFVANQMDHRLLPQLFPEDRTDWYVYLQDLYSHVGDREQFDYATVEQLIDPEGAVDHIQFLLDNGADVEARELVESGFHSLCIIAEYQGLIEGRLQHYAWVEGHELTIGRIRESWKANSPESKQIVSTDTHPPVTANQGNRGFGKSTGLASEVEDRYAAGRKIIDVADLSKLENGLYDMPQSQSDLREVRREMGLPVDFLEDEEYDRPDLEILVPLCPSMEDADIPFMAESSESVVTPFTIPASEIPRSVLNRMLSQTTDVQAQYLDRAYRDLDAEKDDWSLHDLSETILETDAQDGVKRRLYNNLASLQATGFIRTKDCPHTIDWENIFWKKDTITVFSQSLMEEDAHKFMALLYIVHCLYHERKDRRGLPPTTTVFREAHNIAPTDNVAREDDDERELQNALSESFQRLCAEGRHQDVEVYMDTQQLLGQVKKRIREHVERVVTFRSLFGTIKPLFSEMVGLDEGRYDHLKTIAREFEPGQAAVLGFTGTSRDLEMTIEFAPPMSHHLDAESSIDDGWIARTKLPDRYPRIPDEEFRDCPWETDVPEALEFEELDIADDRGAVELFADKCLTESSGSKLGMNNLWDAMLTFCEEMGYDKDDVPSRNSIGMQLSDHVVLEDRQQTTIDGELQTAYYGVAFTPEGQRYLSD